MNDEIIREVWLIKDSIGREFGYDIRSLGALLQQRQRMGHKQIVDLSCSKKKSAEDMQPIPDSKPA
jgi:hypothetical protein